MGLLFAAVALLAAQLTSGPRAAYGLTGAVIGTAYVLRAIGDVGSPVLTWLSPIGWFQAMHAFSGLRWWPLAPLVRGRGRGVRRSRCGPSVVATTAPGCSPPVPDPHVPDRA